MKIYLAGERHGDLWLKNVKRRLFSYFYHSENGRPSREVREAHDLGLDLFLDSGAFTAFAKGTWIDPELYADFVNGNRDIWTTCSSLDAIGEGEDAARRSYENLQILRDRGADVQPVFHVREPDHWLQRYIDEGWEYIFIGGMVPEHTSWLLMRLDGLWDQILSHPDGSPKVRTHGFGLTDQKLMFRYPWYSVDSTSWLMTGIFGACVFRTPNNTIRKVVFSEDSPQARRFNGWHYYRLAPGERRQVDRWLEPYGVTAEECASSYMYRDVVNAAVFQNLEDLAARTFKRQQGTLF